MSGRNEAPACVFCQIVDGDLAGYWVAESSQVYLTPALTPTPTPAPTP